MYKYKFTLATLLLMIGFAPAAFSQVKAKPDTTIIAQIDSTLLNDATENTLDNIFTEYETFLKQLQNEYFNNRKAKTDYDVTKTSPKS